MSNAKRFISAYNKLDSRLRERYNLRSNLTFSETVRICAAKNAVVRKYEDDLNDYGRLRNAIVHKSNSDMIIAEPHLSVVETLEHILELVSAPPRADSTVSKPKATARADASIASVIKMMAQGGFSSVPVISGGKIAGVVTNKIIVEAIARRLSDVDNYIGTAAVSGLPIADGEHYVIVRRDITVDDVLQLFESRKLSIVLLTQNGGADGDLVGVVTTGDIMRMSRLLD